MKRCLFLVVCLLLLAACSKTEEKNVEDSFPLHMEVQKFNAVNQYGEPFTFKNLKGKVWVADFLFTNCDTVCSPMTANMATLQRKLAAAGVDAELVSFSIDPDHDQPGKLKEYAKGVDADFSNWNLLTGYKQPFIESFANKSFMAAAAKLEDSNQFVHSTSFYLINKDGVVLQKYEGASNPPYNEIINDIKTLEK